MKIKPSDSGFSLMEITFAMAIVAFSMTIILSLLPVALKTVQNAAIEQGLGRITQHMRVELQQIPFTGSSKDSDYSIKNIEGKSYFYTLQGFQTDSANKSAYFQTSFSQSNLALWDKTPESYDSSVKAITVKVEYPVEAPASNRNQTTFQMIVAK